MLTLRNKKMSNNVLASRINKLRTISGLSQAAFGASIGTSQAALSAYEKGIRTPSLDILIDISNKYHVSIDWLSGLSDIPNSAQTKTYADLIKSIVLLNDNNHLDITLDRDSAILNFISADKTLIEFFKEWNEMRTLREDLENGDRLYNLWLNDAIKRYDIPLS